MKIHWTRPPWLVTSAIINVLILTGWNAVRLGAGLAQQIVLAEYGAPAAYILGSGLAWTLTGMVLIAALWRQTTYASWMYAMAAVIYFAWYWFDRLEVQGSPNPNAMFMAVVSFLWLAGSLATSYAIRHTIAKERA